MAEGPPHGGTTGPRREQAKRSGGNPERGWRPRSDAAPKGARKRNRDEEAQTALGRLAAEAQELRHV
jgi:hypothetical protein